MFKHITIFISSGHFIIQTLIKRVPVDEKKVTFRPKSQTKLGEFGLTDFNFENKL